MLPDLSLPELLGTYLMPLLIAVPLAVVVILLSRRGGTQPDDLPSEPSEWDSRLEQVEADSIPAVKVAPCILVVDDSAVVRARLSRLFELAGYRVILANNGIEALRVLTQQWVQVVVTDLEMPHKNGFELIADLQGSLATEDLPIVAITGHDDLQARVHDVQGLYGIFKKPWNDRDLLRRVDFLARLRTPKGAALASV